jgi:hypothetical protein
MKTYLKPLLFSVLLLACLAFAQTALAQAPPPPPAEHGTEGNAAPGGGGAPIEGGLVMTLALVAGYGAWKMYRTITNRDQAVEH